MPPGADSSRSKVSPVPISTRLNDGATHDAVALAGRALPADSMAQVFFEERADLRLELSGRAAPNLAATSTRGAAVGEPGRTLHRTDPSLDDLVAMARGDGRWPFPPVDSEPLSGTPASCFDPEWTAAIEAEVFRRAEIELAGLPEPRWRASIVAFHQKVWVAGTDASVVSDVRGGCRFEILVGSESHPEVHAAMEWVLAGNQPEPPAGCFSRAWERLERRRSARPPRPGTTRAVLASGVGGVLVHELVGHALEADVVREAPTWIQAALPSALRMSVIDEPARGRGGWRVDDEGVATGRTSLIEDGRVVGLLLDRSTARLHGAPPNGHARRATYLDPIRPRMGCTYIGHGQDDPADIVRETASGIFIREMSAGHTDPLSGRAVFIVNDADSIVNGAVQEPLAPFIISVDGVEAWRSIDRIGCDLAFDTCVGSCIRDGQPLAVSVGAPTIRIGVITVEC